MPPYGNILFAFFPGESAREPGFRLTTTHLAVDAALHRREEPLVVIVVRFVSIVRDTRDSFKTDETDERISVLGVHLQIDSNNELVMDCRVPIADLTDQEAGSDVHRSLKNARRQTFPNDAGGGLSEGRCWSIFVELAMGEVLTVNEEDRKCAPPHFGTSAGSEGGLKPRAKWQFPTDGISSISKSNEGYILTHICGIG